MPEGATAGRSRSNDGHAREPAPNGSRRLADRAVDAARAVRRPVEHWIVRASTIGAGPFLDPGAFSWTADLEAAHGVVRAELDALLAAGTKLQTSHEVNPGSSVDAARWETVLLRYYGRDCGAASRCPRTMALLDRIPGVRAASFSILWPGATITPHRGPYAGVVRYHLGVTVPRPADGCGIRVGDEVAHWTEGGSLLFDESFEHEAWNRTDGMRAVLFLDIVRPLRQPARTVNAGALAAFAVSPYALVTKRRNQRWEEAHGLAEPTGPARPGPGDG